MRRTLFRLAKVNWLQRSFLAAIAVALVGTQSLGLYHRIEHGTAKWVSASQTARLAQASLADPAMTQGDVAEHHCAAIDALALVNAPPVASILLPVSPPAATHRFGSQTPNLKVTLVRPFNARAPPVLLS